MRASIMARAGCSGGEIFEGEFDSSLVELNPRLSHTAFNPLGSRVALGIRKIIPHVS